MIYCEFLVLLMALSSLVTAIIVGWWGVWLENKWLKLIAVVACAGVICSGCVRFSIRWQMVWEGNKTRTQNSILAEPGDHFFHLLWIDEEGLLYQIVRSPFFGVGVFSVLVVFVLIIIISIKFTKQIQSIK